MAFRDLGDHEALKLRPILQEWPGRRVTQAVGRFCQVKWQFKSMDNNTWVEKDIMVKMGYIKLVQREDERSPARPSHCLATNRSSL